MSPGADRRAWEQPGAHPVTDRIYRIPLPLPGDALRAVNVYAILDGAEVVMVDSGWALDAARQALETALAALDRDLTDISRFLITHVHRDHYTQAVAIRRSLGSRVLLGRGEQANLTGVMTGGEHDRPVALMRRLLTHGAAEVVEQIRRTVRIFEPDDTPWEPPDQWIEDGDLLPVGLGGLRAIATPGHTRGHLVFHDAPARVLFAGDHLLPEITPSIGFEPVSTDAALVDYLRSLDAMLALEDARLLPAHGPVAPSTHDRSRALLAHHHRRLDEMAAAVRAGADTGAEVAQTVRWTSRGRDFAELDLFNQLIAINETVAHLEVLVRQDRITRTVVDGLNLFS